MGNTVPAVTELHIAQHPVNITGSPATATLINGGLPAPVLRWREGQRVHLRVHNHLPVDTSLHWHGLILPTSMDGVPGLSFAGIKPGHSFDYQFDLRQSGTYWYHSHSGFQEQTGLYGAIVIEPRDADPVAYDREHVILLSDWSDEAPEAIYARLKKQSHYYNSNERTLGDTWEDIRRKGVAATWRDRAMWNQMRMSDSDIADVTAMTYTYLMNGKSPAQHWHGLFKKGERVRLRIINGAAMTIFDLRIPGLKMTVVAADGQDIEPITVDEFRIGVAETYDVIVQPDTDQAYSIFAQSIDRGGFACGTLSSDESLRAAPPALDSAPRLAHRDMGMGHAGKNDAHAHHHGHHAMPSKPALQHAATEFGPHVDMRAEAVGSGLDDPGIGLRDHDARYGRRVLRYSDLINRYQTLDTREPSREIELHLTGNMARYMWSINGVPYRDAEPIKLQFGERVRFKLINDTMMTHPMHLHGLWSELETGDALRLPRKHTVLVQPGSSISYQVSADAVGRWAYHCHMMFHMAGMMREVRVAAERGGVS
jgi:CopA family copper-resistance protein